MQTTPATSAAVAEGLVTAISRLSQVTPAVTDRSSQ